MFATYCCSNACEVKDVGDPCNESPTVLVGHTGDEAEIVLNLGTHFSGLKNASEGWQNETEFQEDGVDRRRGFLLPKINLTAHGGLLLAHVFSQASKEYQPSSSWSQSSRACRASDSSNGSTSTTAPLSSKVRQDDFHPQWQPSSFWEMKSQVVEAIFIELYVETSTLYVDNVAKDSDQRAKPLVQKAGFLAREGGRAVQKDRRVADSLTSGVRKFPSSATSRESMMHKSSLRSWLDLPPEPPHFGDKVFTRCRSL